MLYDVITLSHVSWKYGPNFPKALARNGPTNLRSRFKHWWWELIGHIAFYNAYKIKFPDITSIIIKIKKKPKKSGYIAFWPAADNVTIRLDKKHAFMMRWATMNYGNGFNRPWYLFNCVCEKKWQVDCHLHRWGNYLTKLLIFVSGYIVAAINWKNIYIIHKQLL